MSAPVSNAPSIKAVNPNNSNTEWGNAVDRAKAKDAGIEWQRPKDDHRTAEDIIHDSPLLNNLGNQSGAKDKLRERVGDFEHDADAAYRAKQVLEHVERFDETGSRLAGNDIDNGRVDGFTKGGDAKHGTEAGRLQDFGKYGWENLKGELQHADSVGQDDERRAAADKAGIVWELAAGDKRSAQDIINSSVDGFTKSGEARHGTEAGRLQDFGKYGFEALAKPPANDQVGSYKAFLKTNLNVDPGSRQIAQYGAILDAKYDSIRGKTRRRGGQSPSRTSRTTSSRIHNWARRRKRRSTSSPSQVLSASSTRPATVSVTSPAVRSAAMMCRLG